MFQIDFVMVFLAICVYLWIITSRDNENVIAKLAFCKAKIFWDSAVFMLLSKDSKGVGPKKNPDPELIANKNTTTKTIVFIRHGESDWNNVFNKGINISFIFRLLRALFQELRNFATTNSSFIDSPLNFEGIEQALELSRYIEANSEKVAPSDRSYDVLLALAGRNTEKSSVVVSSSLRRAIATTTLALWPRLERTSEKIVILSSLQEMSRNVDTFALSAPNTVADLPFERIAPHCGGIGKFNPSKVYNTVENFGNKSLNFYGIKRLRAFSEWAMQRPEDTIIVGGHSLWFKNFFQTFLPHSSEHNAKNKKLTNSGVVSFTLHACDGEDGTKLFRVDPDSICTVYGGYMTK